MSEHVSEEDLIAYRLHESGNEAAIREHLERCAACAAVAESIAETLRVFSGGPVPEPDLERNWRRLRGNLSVLGTEPRPGWWRARWLWPAAGMVFAALMVVAGVELRHGLVWRHEVRVAKQGPLTEQPVDPAMANHLDAAERLLTEVNNSPEPLDEATREQAHGLLLKNAVYVQQARTGGDVAEAAVLENLGRVLVTLDHEPASESGRRKAPETHRTLGVRLEMNTSGLLLEIRVLRQNDEAGQ